MPCRPYKASFVGLEAQVIDDCSTDESLPHEIRGGLQSRVSGIRYLEVLWEGVKQLEWLYKESIWAVKLLTGYLNPAGTYTEAVDEVPVCHVTVRRD